MSEAAIEEQVSVLLRAYADGIRRRDRPAVLGLFTLDATAIGTGADEWYSGQAALARGLDRDLSQAGEISFAFEAPQVSRLGDVAWLAARASVTAEAEGSLVSLSGRLTAVLVYDGRRWTIAQSHFSLPATDQAEGRSFPSDARA